MSADLSSVSDVDIDIGRFKYILIKLHKKRGGDEFKYIVRGYKWAGFHGKTNKISYSETALFCSSS